MHYDEEREKEGVNTIKWKRRRKGEGRINELT